MLKKNRLICCVEYNGSRYIGWQKQNENDLSIQSIIECKLYNIFGYYIRIFCSSRTDSGVHSIGQIFHFDILNYIDIKKILYSLNSILPNDINIKWIKYVNFNFHSRYNALARRYIYIIYNSAIKSSFLNKLVTFCNYKLDINLMIKSSRFLIGKHNFSSFRSSGCESKNPVKIIYYLNIFKKNHFIYFDIKANSFLYKMVRNIISCLLLVGLKKYSIFWLKDFLYYRNRKSFYFNTIKPYGLYLVSIYY